MSSVLYGPEAWAPLARALVDFWRGNRGATLLVHTDGGETDPMPVSVFFRGRDAIGRVDREALARARGRVLDGGAGVGSHALLLQEEGLSVTAVEVIPEAVEIMRARGVDDAREGRLEQLVEVAAFDTILLLMNGTALAGTVTGFPGLLRTLERLLAPGGQVLMDSTDLVGRGEEDPETGEEYLGELQYQVEYGGAKGAPFPQLFLDPATLSRMAAEEGWATELVLRGRNGEYLASLTRLDPAPS